MSAIFLHEQITPGSVHIANRFATFHRRRSRRLGSRILVLAVQNGRFLLIIIFHFQLPRSQFVRRKKYFYWRSIEFSEHIFSEQMKRRRSSHRGSRTPPSIQATMCNLPASQTNRSHGGFSRYAIPYTGTSLEKHKYVVRFY